MLKLENINKSFGNKKVINNVSLSVQRGEIALLLGPSGVGKSTIIRMLNNLETLDSGTITLDDKVLDIAKANTSHTVGMVFQQFNLFEHVSVIENITLPLEITANKSKSEAMAIAKDLLEHFSLSDKAPVSIHKLSGGQKQRLALARTLALKPKIICFDEPTSALDPLLTAHVATSIKQLAHDGFMVIVSTHDASLVERLNATMYLMDDGDIVESTTWKEFCEQREKFQRLQKFLNL